MTTETKKPVRKPANILRTDEIDSLVDDYRSGKYSMAGLARKYNIVPSTVYRHLQVHGEKETNVGNPIEANALRKAMATIKDVKLESIPSSELVYVLWSRFVDTITTNPFKKTKKNKDDKPEATKPNK